MSLVKGPAAHVKCCKVAPVSWPSSKNHKRIKKWKSINNCIVLYSIWNTDINSHDQQVAVEYFVFGMGCISPQLLPMAVSATLIGNWQTDFVIDHNARGNDDCIIAGATDSWKDTISLKLHRRQIALSRLQLSSDGKVPYLCVCVCKQYDCSWICMCVVMDAFRRAHRRWEEENRHRLSRASVAGL